MLNQLLATFFFCNAKCRENLSEKSVLLIVDKDVANILKGIEKAINEYYYEFY